MPSFAARPGRSLQRNLAASGERYRDVAGRIRDDEPACLLRDAAPSITEVATLAAFSIVNVSVLHETLWSNAEHVPPRRLSACSAPSLILRLISVRPHRQADRRRGRAQARLPPELFFMTREDLRPAFPRSVGTPFFIQQVRLSLR